MKSQIFITLIISLALFSCDFRKPINKDLTTSKDSSVRKDLTKGIITKPEGLSCNDVWISIDEEKTDRITFIYGETFNLNFNNMEGFSKVNGNVFPGMMLKVTDEKGDTIIKTEDEYADSVNGLNLSLLSIKADFDVVQPVHSNHKYTLYVNIWDKKGEGTLIAEAPFSVIQNEKINIETNYITYDEIFLLSVDRNKVITDGSIYFDEIVYLVFEGLSGFYEENGKVFPGARFQVVDYSFTPIMSYNDLFYFYTKTGINSEDFKSQTFLKMSFAQGKVNNPLLCEATIFDKKRNAAHITVTTELNVK
jgi:hypothetical protein